MGYLILVPIVILIVVVGGCLEIRACREDETDRAKKRLADIERERQEARDHERHRDLTGRITYKASKFRGNA
jgi:hypothetical protein